LRTKYDFYKYNEESDQRKSLISQGSEIPLAKGGDEYVYFKDISSEDKMEKVLSVKNVKLKRM
jgi:hypothetical protein